MSTPPLSDVARYFDDLAGRWDSLMTPDGRTRAVIEESLAALAVRPGDTVLDAGCGTGALFPFLLPLVGPAGSVNAVACYQAFPHFAHQRRVVGGFASLLAPGGRFIVFHPASSDEVNAFHATLPPPVNGHRLPPAAVLGAWARAAGLAIREELDDPGLYRVVGEKPKKRTTGGHG